MILPIKKPQPKQEEFLRANAKHIGFGGARGGGKSEAVRIKAKLLAVRYPGIKILIVRRTYPELINNHIRILRQELIDVAKYNDNNKILTFINGSTIQFTYCSADRDLDRMQGIEVDVVFFDEATQLSEYQMKALTACIRGVNSFPKRAYYTANPGGVGHSYIKRIFIDKQYEADENPDDYVFIQSLVTDNTALMRENPDYIEQLKALPEKLKRAWLYGDWNIFEGQYFEEFRMSPDIMMCSKSGVDPDTALKQRRWTHVIKPFNIPDDWTIYRSFDWGYSKPFSCGWWAVDHDGTLYRILEFYGCKKNEPNTGLKMTPDKVFSEIHKIETDHEWLKNKRIIGIADPAIWNKERGVSIYEMAVAQGVYFTKGDNKRVPGWNQVHYRLSFNDSGYPKMYVFENCKDFIRTIPLLMYDEHKVEDLDTEGEDHIADETRYMCMSKPIKPAKAKEIDTYYSSELYRALEIPKENLVDYEDKDLIIEFKE